MNLEYKKGHNGLLPSVTPVYAAVDVGSNNVRIDLFGFNEAGKLVSAWIPEKTSFDCKLAEGMDDRDPVIGRSNFAQALKALAMMDAIINKYEIDSARVLTIMTDAVRSVQETEQGRADTQELIAAFGQRPSIIVTGREESLLCGEAIKIDIGNKLRFIKGGIAFAAIGGGSVQMGIITSDGTITDEISLPYGIHKLNKASEGEIPAAGKIFRNILQEYYPEHVCKYLHVMGSNWRALGEAVCVQALPATIRGRKNIRAELLSATHRDEAYYKIFARAKERAPFMPMSAAMLRRVAGHLDASQLVFSGATIRQPMAHYMHGLETGTIKTPPLGLERLFAPSGP